MKQATLQSRCECQTRLRAQVSESGTVLGGTAIFQGQSYDAPATGMNVGHSQFQVGWLCTFCGRNVVRSFYRGALEFATTSQ